MNKYILLFVLLSFGTTLEAKVTNPAIFQSQPPKAVCTATEARQFDFWIGDWAITQKILQADGSWLELPATTRVSSTLNGCALIEHWDGKVLFFWEGMKEAEPLQGLSIRSFDPKTGNWSIYWMDTRNPRFGVFEGEFRDGRGEFFRNSTSSDGKPLISRITFSGATKTAVQWELAVSRNEGQSWQIIWTMRMRRKRM